MTGGLGALSGGADALREILRQKFAEAMALKQHDLARKQQELSGRRMEQEDAFRRDSLASLQAQRDDAAAAHRFTQDQALAKQDEQAQAGARQQTQAHLRAAIQGSQNVAGTDDPNGSPGTRNALRVALTAGGAKGNEIPQEPEAAPKPKMHAVTVPGPNGQPMHKLVTEEEMQQGVQGYRAPKEPAGQGAKFWVVRDGQMLRITDAEYRPGDQPANSREQGRPVMSSDAGRIADLDTSMDDLNVLTRDLGKTGTASKVGAMLPNAITDLTGIGADAKSRQAVIDRVKQVIGKALEGGVLRKEDEIKYEKILPTIGDAPDVAERKLQGLFDALEKRRQTQIESLSDAGYDVSKFSARPKRQREDAAAGGDSGGNVNMVAPDGRRLSVPAADVERMLSLGAKKAG
jgi:hypothetical protein